MKQSQLRVVLQDHVAPLMNGESVLNDDAKCTIRTHEPVVQSGIPNEIECTLNVEC